MRIPDSAARSIPAPDGGGYVNSDIDPYLKIGQIYRSGDSSVQMYDVDHVWST